ncbi:hydrogenase formation protein HypD [uncultured Mailhella sp.]|uniref:hydrogenase formation protein HypD n=1 Tax=uncultured Mailhella sp. TaxID=1981031 RepID=UPI0025CE8599|nr:hydrogenase formation protein HypD [uncultured Mailhella sp.]
MDISSSFHDPALCRALLERLSGEIEALGRPVRFMEVCGTHTVSLFQSGLRSLLPQGLEHLSGPGCPVCVTHDAEVAAFIRAAEKPGVIVATFGDLLRVPGPDGRSLKNAMAEGARVEVVYSPLDAVRIASEHPSDTVVFPSVGFETTAPVIAGALMAARRAGLSNFCIVPCNKLVPPAMRALLDGEDGRKRIDAFLLPGHVAVVLGLEPFRFLAREYGRPAVVGGFEPADILSALCLMVGMLREGKPAVGNTYIRAVHEEGSPQARHVMETVFSVADARWRGLGLIPDSGLALRGEWRDFDAMEKLGLELEETKPIPGCRCGDILRGVLTPEKCPLFGRVCTPQNPTGPCMVSTEGSCAAWYRYRGM